MKCPRCQYENPPGSNFCLGCGTRLGATCGACGNDLPVGSRFCNKCGTPVSVESAGQARFTLPEAYTPKHLAERILTSKAALEGERKQVTVLFADLKGSMELIADRDPEQVRALLDTVVEHMMEAVHRYEGTVNNVMGDGVMALFGAPIAHEDHAVRASYAALRMQASVRRYAEVVRRTEGVSVQIRVGLNSGEVVVRSIGSDLRMDYTALGQTTHLAARMEQLATPGTILISPETLRLSEGWVQVTPLGPVNVKGLAEPVEVFELIGAGMARTRMQAAAARGLTRFVGRDAELDTMRRALDRAREGRGQIVAVVGEPGVGKSRLVWEFTRSHRTQGWLILESGSVSYGKATPYLPAIGLLKAYFHLEGGDDARTITEKVTGKLLTLDRTLEPLLPALLALLDVPVEDGQWRDLDPAERRRRTLDAVKRLLLRESQVQPLCVVLEDLHWMDSETQALLDSLVEALPSARVLLVVNYRPQYQHGWGSRSFYRQLQIDPLQPESANELLQAMLGDGPDLAPLKQLLVGRTEGNPFFLEESVRTLLETKALVGERGAYRVAKPVDAIQVPSTVQAVLAARIDRLSPERKELLQTASVIGKDVPFALLQAIAGLAEDDLQKGLSELQATELLYETRLFPDHEYTFKHALTHEVAYGSVLRDRRKALHAKVVEALERLAGQRLAEYAEVLARHALAAELWEKAVDYLRDTGGRAWARGAVRESFERYEQALAILTDLPPNPENLRRAIDVRLDLYLPLLTLGQLSRLTDLQQEAERLARRLDDKARLARVAYRMSAHCLVDARYAEGISHAQLALDLGEALGAAEVVVSATYIQGAHQLWLGRYRLAEDLFIRVIEGPHLELAKRPLELAMASPYIASCSYLAWCLATTGDFPRASMYGELATRAAEASNHPAWQAYSYSYRAWSLLYKGESEEAFSWGDKALRLCESKNLLLWLPVACAGCGWILARSGQAVEGLPYLERAVALWEKLGIRTGASVFQWVSAEGLLLAGKLDQAWQTAQKALELASASAEHGNEAEALRTLGDIATAQDPRNPEGAATLYHRARLVGEELGMRPLVAHCHLGLGKLFRLAGKREQATEHLTTATTMYREMGMAYWLEKAEQEMKELA